MAQNITKGHIKIDGQEYLIDERSYNSTETPDLAPRIGAGTQGYQDHIIFKNDAQSIWGGGYDFKFLDDFTNPTTFLDSRNVDIFNKIGEFGLSRRLDEAAIQLLASGARYNTNTQAGFDEGDYNQAESTSTPDIRAAFDAATSVYTVKEDFDGGGIDSEFTLYTDGGSSITESGGFCVMTPGSEADTQLTGTTTTIKGFKVDTAKKTGTFTGNFSFRVGMQDGSDDNRVRFLWEYSPDPDTLKIEVRGTNYGTFDKQIPNTPTATVEVKEINGNQIQVIVDGVVHHTINAAVESTNTFTAGAQNLFAPTGAITFQYDTISYWDYTYYTSGDWRSAQYTNTGGSGDNIVELFIEHGNLDATNYIDKISIIDASNNSALSNYTANITTGASSTFTGLSANGWSTPWDNASLDDKDIKVKLFFVTSGAKITPTVTSNRVTFSSTGATQSVDGLIPWNSDLYMWGSKQLWKTSDGSTWTNQTTATSSILDAEPFSGRLYFAEGAGGYEFTATGAALTGRTGASGFNADYFKSNTSGGSGRLYAVDSDKLAYSDDPEVAVPTWTTAYIHAGGTGETYFLGKPEVHNRFVYYSVNRGDTTNGPGSIWVYDHQNGSSLLVVQEDAPISKKIISFAGKLVYALLEKTSIVVKAVDGGSVRTLKRIDLDDATFQDPVEWQKFEGKLNLIAESSSATAFQYQYDPSQDRGNGEGWVRVRTLSSDNANGEYVMGSLDRELYIGNNAGEVNKVSTSFHTDGELTSGSFDAGQFKIDKKFISMEIFHDPLPANTKIVVQYKIGDDTSFTDAEASNEVDDSTSFVANIPDSNNTGKKLDYKIKLTSTDGTDTPKIKDIIVTYQFVEPFRKQWQFGVIVTDSIEYLDGSREQKSASDLYGTLQNSRRSTDSGTIDFYDIDGELHKVDYMRISTEVPRVVGDTTVQDYLVGIQLIETRDTPQV